VTDSHEEEAVERMASRITTVVGARPQFVKAAVVSAALRDAGIEERLVHTGQHHDEQMSAIFFNELLLPPPALHLGVHGGSHGEMTGRMLELLERDLLEVRPDMVLVYGDTNSTLAGALAAAKLGVPVAHVEAGLRSFNRRMPEEINRVVTDHLSSLLLCPTSTSVTNLRREGIDRGVVHVGDVMFDASLAAAGIAAGRSTVIADLGLPERAYVVATVHRAENTDDPQRLRRVFAHLAAEARTRRVILPLHPRTREAIARHDVDTGDVELVEPLGYLDMTALVAAAGEVHTDSGGLQKEAYFHRVPCVTLRDETEWVETVECGWNRLWTTRDYAARRPIEEFGDGDAATTIAALVRDA